MDFHWIRRVHVLSHLSFEKLSDRSLAKIFIKISASTTYLYALQTLSDCPKLFQLIPSAQDGKLSECLQFLLSTVSVPNFFEIINFYAKTEKCLLLVSKLEPIYYPSGMNNDFLPLIWMQVDLKANNTYVQRGIP